MNFIRVGVIDLFGILCPGVLLLANLFVFMLIFGLPVKDIGVSISELDSALLVLMLFVSCYLLGFILRLISPDYLDKTSIALGRILYPRIYWIEKPRLHLIHQEMNHFQSSLLLYKLVIVHICKRHDFSLCQVEFNRPKIFV